MKSMKFSESDRRRTRPLIWTKKNKELGDKASEINPTRDGQFSQKINW